MLKNGDVVYLVKYALREGLTREIVDRDESDCGFVTLVGRGWIPFSVKRGEVVTDENLAIAIAESKRAKKLASIEKHAAKLRKRDFAAELAKRELRDD